MLQAELKDGTLIVLATLTRREIEQLRETSLFYCPVCKERVIMKAGQQVIPHFAHQSIKNCPASGQGEGPYHKKGKVLLYKWLLHQGLHVQLEKYIKEINQQPDLFITIGRKKIVIEYQCARVNISHIQRRNKGYQEAGITPIWILGAELFNRQSTNTLKIDAYTKQFIHQFSPKCLPTLYYFCPFTNQFALFQDIHFSRQRRAIGRLQFKRLNNLSFYELFHYKSIDKLMLYTMWKKEKRAFRLTHPRRVFGREKSWYEWLYARRTHRELLPSIIYLPNSMQLQMNSSLWDWQSRICIDLIMKLTIGGQFTVTNCKALLRDHITRRSYYPLFQPTKTAITEYLHILEELHVIKGIASNRYVKINAIEYYKNIEVALNRDNILMNKMIQNCETNYEHNEGDVRYTK